MAEDDLAEVVKAAPLNALQNDGREEEEKKVHGMVGRQKYY